MPNPGLTRLLAWLGTLPFIGGALLHIGRVDALGSPQLLVSSYGLAILCFLAGAHWATYLYRSDACPMNLLLTSNVVVVAVWLAYLFLAPAPALLTQAVAFVVMLAIDMGLQRRELISRHYLATRLQATTIAVISLVVIVALSLG